MESVNTEDLNRIRLVIQRMLDGDALLEDEAVAMLAEVDRAVHSLDVSSQTTARKLKERLIQLTGGRAVVEAGWSGSELP